MIESVGFFYHNNQIMDSKNEKDTKSLEEEEERNFNCFKSIYKNITIEPAMFVLGLAGGVVGPFFAQFEITKICKFDFGYNETVCNDENLVKYFKEENDEIQKEVGVLETTTSNS